MVRNKIIVIKDEILKIFVANNNNNDEHFMINMDKIKKEKYHCGIILNQNNTTFEDILSIPCYYIDYPMDYYTLDIIHSPNNLEYTKKYRFIFVNIHYLSKGMFSNDNDINPDSVEIGILKKNIPFNDWLVSVLDEGLKMDKLFIVSNITPFYLLKIYPYNFYINNFMLTLMKYAHSDITYLSTDNDYYQNITIYDHSSSLKQIININFIMVGSLGEPKKLPIIFVRHICDNFYGKIGYFSNKFSMEKFGGYFEIILNNKTKNLLYKSIVIDALVKYIVQQAIRLIQKNGIKKLSEDEIKLLELYKSMIETNNYISYYKRITYSKINFINFKRWLFLDKIVPEINKIMEDHLYS